MHYLKANLSDFYLVLVVYNIITSKIIFELIFYQHVISDAALFLTFALGEHLLPKLAIVSGLEVIPY